MTGKSIQRIFTTMPTHVPRFRLQYASNLHITRHDKPVFPHFIRPAARHLALVGDIGEPEHKHFANLFTYAAQHWFTVIYSPCPNTNQEAVVEYTKHLDNVHILTKKNPYYMFEAQKIALWSPFEDATAYRKLFVMSYDSVDYRAYLENLGCIYSHGINGDSGKGILVNSRGDKETPAEGFSATKCLNVL